MPFTLSHPAAAALLRPPGRRSWLPLAPLAIGTMTPDFEFFVHLRPVSLWSHTAAGLVGFCLPAGLATLLAWELLVRDPARHLLALPRGPHANGVRWTSAAWWLRAVAAILAGATTHLFWDGFTHGGYWGARFLPGLRATAFTALGHAVPWFNLLQHTSTLVGGLVVLAWLGRELRSASAVTVIRRSRWRVAVLLAIALAALGVGLWTGRRPGGPPVPGYPPAEVVVGRAAVGALLGLGLAVLAYAAVHRWVGRRGGVPNDRAGDGA